MSAKFGIVAESRYECKVLSSTFRFALIPLRGRSPEETAEEFKNEEKGASHYPYAYVEGSRERCSDDGEPHAAAGLPFLNLLRSRELDGVLLICARHFGGTKLGLGRLKHVFSDGAKQVIALAKVGEIVITDTYEVEVPFERMAAAENLLKRNGVAHRREIGAEMAVVSFDGNANICAALETLGLKPSFLGSRKSVKEI